MSLDNDHKKMIMKFIRKKLPDAVASVDESDWIFDDKCGCYSRYTTEACSLTIGVVSPSTGEKDYKLRQRVEDAVEKWAQSHLSWSGCKCCDHSLYVHVCIFKEQQVR